MNIQCFNTIYWKDYTFPIELSWKLSQKSLDYIYVDLFQILYLIRCSTDQYIYPYANISHCLDYYNLTLSLEIKL